MNLGKFILQRRKGRRGCKVIFIALITVIFFIGCDSNPNHEDTGFIPVGEWIGPDDWGTPDKYIITNNKIIYVDPWNFNNFAGEIIFANDFTSNAGVLIIKILNNPVPDVYTANKYTCVYYKDFSPSHILFASPIDAEYNYIEADTLDAAKKRFTVDNVGELVLYWGSYTK